MRLSEIKGEQALDVLADLIEPVAEICADEEVKKLHEENAPMYKIVKPMIKNHKKAVIDIMATLDGIEPDKYEVNLLTLPIKLLEILNDKDIQQLFTFAE